MSIFLEEPQELKHPPRESIVEWYLQPRRELISANDIVERANATWSTGNGHCLDRYESCRPVCATCTLGEGGGPGAYDAQYPA